MVLKEGTVLQNRYRIVGVVGGGGQRIVYRAIDLKGSASAREVAVKQMHRDKSYIKHVANARLMKQELEILTSLNHPSLPRVLDVFYSGANYFIITEFVHGRMLKELIEEKSISEVEALEYVRQIAAAAEFLHMQKAPIVVRDLKPSNVMVNSDGRACLIDLGGAGVDSDDSLGVGTPGYTPPEGIRSKGFGADIYALGVMIHQAATGLDVNASTAVLPRMSSIRKDADRGLQYVVDTATAHHRSKRYQMAWELRQDLEECLRRRARGGHSLIHVGRRLRAVLGVVMLVAILGLFLVQLAAHVTAGSVIPIVLALPLLLPLTAWALACHIVWQGWVNAVPALTLKMRALHEGAGPLRRIDWLVLLNAGLYGSLWSHILPALLRHH
ncbi:MAG: serine/threonine-protein kinase [Candidatus Xenobia bacterium]